MPIPLDTDPNARAECPECFALVRVARWREHDEQHRALERRLDGIEDALKEPAPDPELAEWPAADEPPAAPAGPYAPEGPAL